jgi:PEP-utilising enzyme, PEP-binding domain
VTPAGAYNPPILADPGNRQTATLSKQAAHALSSRQRFSRTEACRGLTLGLDRDSGTVAHLFDERNDAVRWLIARAIAAARRIGKPIGICGQAPSDYPEFAAWLVSEGIDSITLNPDVAVATTLRVARAEEATPTAAASR